VETENGRDSDEGATQQHTPQGTSPSLPDQIAVEAVEKIRQSQTCPEIVCDALVELLCQSDVPSANQVINVLQDGHSSN
jgi:hypothetical protein